VNLHQPRYIDTSKCVACGDCAKVCPVIIPDKFNEGLSQRRAVYKLYPQAVPNAFCDRKARHRPLPGCLPERAARPGLYRLDPRRPLGGRPAGDQDG
jgi:ferredoxin